HDRRMNVAVQELDEHQVVHVGDRDGADSLGRQGDLPQLDIGVAELDVAFVVVLVAAACVRVDRGDDTELGRPEAVKDVLDDRLDQRDEVGAHSDTNDPTWPRRPPDAAPAAPPWPLKPTTVT